MSKRARQSNSTVNSRINSRKDKIVAVRMPRGLVDELKDIQKVNHFMDMSDEIRFIVRKYFDLISQSGTPQKELENVFLENKRKEKLIEDLNNIINQLQTGKSENENQ